MNWIKIVEGGEMPESFTIVFIYNPEYYGKYKISDYDGLHFTDTYGIIYPTPTHYSIPTPPNE